MNHTAIMHEETTLMNTAVENGTDEQRRVVELRGIFTGKERQNLSSFQRVAAGFFAQTKEPALTINGKMVGVNAASVRMFPGVEYMEILISSEERKIAFKPCDELSISGYKWAKEKNGKLYATQRTGEPFVLCVCEIMGWNPENRYRILGKKILDETDEEILCFDLTAGQGFAKASVDAKAKTRSTILTGWDGTFGPVYVPGEGRLHIGTYNDYTYISIGRKNRKTETEKTRADNKPASEAEDRL